MFKWLRRLDHLFPIRYTVWALCAIGLLASAVAWHRMGTSLWLVALFLVVFVAFAMIGSAIEEGRWQVGQ